MIFRVLATLLFICIIAGSFWLGGQQREAPVTTTVASASADLGYSARSADLIETGPEGRPMYTLDADLIRQRPDDGVLFDRVKLTFRDAQGQTWTGHADHGSLETDSGKVNLEGNVHVDGVLPGSSQLADLATEKLLVDTRGQIISTDQQVVVTSVGHVLKSRGMLALLKERRLELEASVHGTFLP
jgi:LPS export ABC transporter protein LptC